jgi:uncharacterized protein
MISDIAKPNASLFIKIIQFPLVRLVLGIIAVVAPLSLVQLGFDALHLAKGSPLKTVGALLGCAAAVAGYLLFVRYTERRKVSELGLQGSLGEWATGLAIGAIMFALTIGTIALFGSYKIIGMNPVMTIVPVAIMSIIAGITEEILLRALFFRILEEWTGSWIALAASALLFGGLHMMNPNATPTAAIAIALEAGLMLGAAFMVTRRLWLVFGIHMAWNFTQGGIFGVAVSGFKSSGLFQSTLSGPALISGGEFGAEASIFAVIFGVLLTLILVRLAIRRGNVHVPLWRRAKASSNE